MNAPEYWWVLSMSAGCLYILLAGTDYQNSILSKAPIGRVWPQWMKLGIYHLSLPLLLAVCSLSLSDWLTAQSFPAWLLKIEEFGKVAGVLLSLQAVYFLVHGKVFGAWLLLVASTLTLQLWLYYQALGIDFRLLAQGYAAALFIAVAAVSFALHAIDTRFKVAFARPLAILVVIAQWLFSTAAVPANSIAGFGWLTLNTTLMPIGSMALLVFAGYAWNGWRIHSRGSART